MTCGCAAAGGAEHARRGEPVGGIADRQRARDGLRDLRHELLIAALIQSDDGCAARGLAALIDGLWLRGALSGDAFNTEQALHIAYEYLDQQLAKAEA